MTCATCRLPEAGCDCDVRMPVSPNYPTHYPVTQPSPEEVASRAAIEIARVLSRTPEELRARVLEAARILCGVEK